MVNSVQDTTSYDTHHTVGHERSSLSLSTGYYKLWHSSYCGP